MSQSAHNAGLHPDTTAHDKRPPACRPPEFLFPRRFNCGTWRGNNFSTGPFPTGNTPHIHPVSGGDTPTITRRRQSHTPPFHSQTTTRFPIPPFAFGDTRRYRLHPFAGRIKYKNVCSYTWHKPKWYHRGDVMSAKKTLSSHSGLRALRHTSRQIRRPPWRPRPVTARQTGQKRRAV